MGRRAGAAGGGAADGGADGFGEASEAHLVALRRPQPALVLVAEAHLGGRREDVPELGLVEEERFARARDDAAAVAAAAAVAPRELVRLVEADVEERLGQQRAHPAGGVAAVGVQHEEGAQRALAQLADGRRRVEQHAAAEQERLPESQQPAAAERGEQRAAVGLGHLGPRRPRARRRRRSQHQRRRVGGAHLVRVGGGRRLEQPQQRLGVAGIGVEPRRVREQRGVVAVERLELRAERRHRAHPHVALLGVAGAQLVEARQPVQPPVAEVHKIGGRLVHAARDRRELGRLGVERRREAPLHHVALARVEVEDRDAEAAHRRLRRRRQAAGAVDLRRAVEGEARFDKEWGVERIGEREAAEAVLRHGLSAPPAHNLWR